MNRSQLGASVVIENEAKAKARISSLKHVSSDKKPTGCLEQQQLTAYEADNSRTLFNTSLTHIKSQAVTINAPLQAFILLEPLPNS